MRNWAMDLVVPYFKKISLGASGRKSDTSSNGGLEKHRWRCMLALVHWVVLDFLQLFFMNAFKTIQDLLTMRLAQMHQSGTSIVYLQRLLFRKIGFSHWSPKGNLTNLVNRLYYNQRRSIRGVLTTTSGWWFGCHFWHFPINIGNISSSLNWRSHIFQRGGPTTNQIKDPHPKGKPYENPMKTPENQRQIPGVGEIHPFFLHLFFLHDNIWYPYWNWIMPEPHRNLGHIPAEVSLQEVLDPLLWKLPLKWNRYGFVWKWGIYPSNSIIRNFHKEATMINHDTPW